MSADRDRLASPPRVNWQLLKEWIASKETFERENPGQAAPMSPPELQAVALLLPPPLVETEPDLGNKNWIGLLQRYVDAHRRTTGVVYSDEETTFTSLGGQPVIRWISYCKIGEYSERFPNIGFGMERNARRPPSFMKKKNARQYAAQNAIAYLMQNNHMPKDGENVVFPRQAMSASSTSNSPAPSLAGRPGGASLQSGMSAGSSQRDPQTTDTSPDGGGGASLDGLGGGGGVGGVSNAQLVAQICSRLGIVPPAYQLEKNPEIEGMWNGYAKFSDERMPQRIGEVTDMYSKRLVKEAIAEDVLRWLRIVEKERNRLKDAVLNGTLDTEMSTAPGLGDS